MKTLTLVTSKGTFILIDPNTFGKTHLPTDIEYIELGRLKNFKDSDYDKIVDDTESKGAFERIIKDTGHYLFVNPKPLGVFAMTETGIVDTAKSEWEEAEGKTFYNPIILQKL